MVLLDCTETKFNNNGLSVRRYTLLDCDASKVKTEILFDKNDW